MALCRRKVRAPGNALAVLVVGPRPLHDRYVWAVGRKNSLRPDRLLLPNQFAQMLRVTAAGVPPGLGAVFGNAIHILHVGQAEGNLLGRKMRKWPRFANKVAVLLYICHIMVTNG